MGVYEDFKKAFQDIVAPEIKAIYGEIKTLHIEIKRLDEKIDLVRSELSQKIDAVDKKIDLVKSELSQRIISVDEKIDLVRNELIAEIRRSDGIVEVELRRIDNELALSRELRDSINKLKERIFVLEAKAA
ncbi:MAG: hypothetical protein V2A53_07170 [bacterium]